MGFSNRKSTGSSRRSKQSRRRGTLSEAPVQEILEIYEKDAQFAPQWRHLYRRRKRNQRQRNYSTSDTSISSVYTTDQGDTTIDGTKVRPQTTDDTATTNHLANTSDDTATAFHENITDESGNNYESSSRSVDDEPISRPQHASYETSKPIHAPAHTVKSPRMCFLCCAYEMPSNDPAYPGMSIEEENNLRRENQRIRHKQIDDVLDYVDKEKDVFQIEVIPVTEQFQDLGVMNYAELEGTGMVFVPTFDDAELDARTQTSMPWWLRDTYTETATCDESEKQAQRTRFCCLGPITFQEPAVSDKVAGNDVLAKKRRDLKQILKKQTVSSKKHTPSEPHLGADIHVSSNFLSKASEQAAIYIENKDSPQKYNLRTNPNRVISPKQQHTLGPTLPSLTPSPANDSRRLKYERVFFPEQSSINRDYQFDIPTSTYRSESSFVLHEGVPMRKNDIVDCTRQEEYERVRKLNEVIHRHDQVSSASRASSSIIADSYRVRGHFESNEGESSYSDARGTTRTSLYLHGVPGYVQHSVGAYCSEIDAAIIEGIPSTLGAAPVVSGFDVAVGVDCKKISPIVQRNTVVTAPISSNEKLSNPSPFAPNRNADTKSPKRLGRSPRNGRYPDSPIHIEQYTSDDEDINPVNTPSSRVDMIMRHRLNVQSMQNSTDIQSQKQYDAYAGNPHSDYQAHDSNLIELPYDKSLRSNHVLEYSDPSNSLKDDETTVVTKTIETKVSPRKTIFHVDNTQVNIATSPLTSCLDFDFSPIIETVNNAKDRQQHIASPSNAKSPTCVPQTPILLSNHTRDDLGDVEKDPRSPHHSPSNQNASPASSQLHKSPNTVKSKGNDRTFSPRYDSNINSSPIRKGNGNNNHTDDDVSMSGRRSDCPIEVKDPSCEIVEERYMAKEVINLTEKEDLSISMQHMRHMRKKSGSELPSNTRNWDEDQNVTPVTEIRQEPHEKLMTLLANIDPRTYANSAQELISKAFATGDRSGVLLFRPTINIYNNSPSISDSANSHGMISRKGSSVIDVTQIDNEHTVFDVNYMTTIEEAKSEERTQRTKASIQQEIVTKPDKSLPAETSDDESGDTDLSGQSDYVQERKSEDLAVGQVALPMTIVWVKETKVEKLDTPEVLPEAQNDDDDSELRKLAVSEQFLRSELERIQKQTAERKLQVQLNQNPKHIVLNSDPDVTANQPVHEDHLSGKVDRTNFFSLTAESTRLTSPYGDAIKGSKQEETDHQEEWQYRRAQGDQSVIVLESPPVEVIDLSTVCAADSDVSETEPNVNGVTAQGLTMASAYNNFDFNGAQALVCHIAIESDRSTFSSITRTACGMSFRDAFSVTDKVALYDESKNNHQTQHVEEKHQSMTLNETGHNWHQTAGRIVAQGGQRYSGLSVNSGINTLDDNDRVTSNDALSQPFVPRSPISSHENSVVIEVISLENSDYDLDQQVVTHNEAYHSCAESYTEHELDSHEYSEQSNIEEKFSDDRLYESKHVRFASDVSRSSHENQLDVWTGSGTSASSAQARRTLNDSQHDVWDTANQLSSRQKSHRRRKTAGEQEGMERDIVNKLTGQGREEKSGRRPVSQEIWTSSSSNEDSGPRNPTRNKYEGKSALSQDRLHSDEMYHEDRRIERTRRAKKNSKPLPRKRSDIMDSLRQGDYTSASSYNGNEEFDEPDVAKLNKQGTRLRKSKKATKLFSREQGTFERKDKKASSKKQRASPKNSHVRHHKDGGNELHYAQSDRRKDDIRRRQRPSPRSTHPDPLEMSRRRRRDLNEEIDSHESVYYERKQRREMQHDDAQMEGSEQHPSSIEDTEESEIGEDIEQSESIVTEVWQDGSEHSDASVKSSQYSSEYLPESFQSSHGTSWDDNTSGSNDQSEQHDFDDDDNDETPQHPQSVASSSIGTNTFNENVHVLGVQQERSSLLDDLNLTPNSSIMDDDFEMETDTTDIIGFKSGLKISSREFIERRKSLRRDEKIGRKDKNVVSRPYNSPVSEHGISTNSTLLDLLSKYAARDGHNEDRLQRLRLLASPTNNVEDDLDIRGARKKEDNAKQPSFLSERVRKEMMIRHRKNRQQFVNADEDGEKTTVTDSSKDAEKSIDDQSYRLRQSRHQFSQMVKSSTDSHSKLSIDAPGKNKLDSGKTKVDSGKNKFDSGKKRPPQLFVDSKTRSNPDPKNQQEKERRITGIPEIAKNNSITSSLVPQTTILESPRGSSRMFKKLEQMRKQKPKDVPASPTVQEPDSSITSPRAKRSLSSARSRVSRTLFARSKSPFRGWKKSNNNE